MTVFVVVTGEGGDGYEIDSVFATREAAEKYLDQAIPTWIKDKHGIRRPNSRSCAYAKIKEFKVAS